MHTSGSISAIQRRTGSILAMYGTQYGSSVRPLSNATPTAGTCDVPSPPTISAMRGALRPGAVALDRTPTAEHHRRVVVGRHARLGGGELLERHAVACRELERVVHVAAELEQPVPAAFEH